MSTTSLVLLTLATLFTIGSAVTIQNVVTGECLTMSTGSSYIQTVTMAPCDGRLSQNWESIPIFDAPGYRMLQNSHNPEDPHCLDNGGLKLTVYAHGCNGGDFQSWSEGSIIRNPTLDRCLGANTVNNLVSDFLCFSPTLPGWRLQRWTEV